MVSFSCENCGDILTKKKLDPHRNQCYGASFTCIDCMVHFQGTDYRAHTSCMSEAQKYQGHLYRGEKKGKGGQRKPDQALVPHKAPEPVANTLAVVDVPPRAPTPPQTGEHLPPGVNVFDYLVSDKTPARHALPPSAEAQQNGGANHYQANGYSYGTAPVDTSSERYNSQISLPQPPYVTPASKRDRNATNKGSEKNQSDKKRKRAQVDDLDLAHPDQQMTDATPALHSGLTGGLNRMLSGPDFGHSDAVAPSPLSPKKRSKKDKSETTKKTSSNRHQSRRDSSSSGDDARSSKRVVSANAGQDKQVVPYRSQAELFLSFITKGPDSERGLSINKALKRYHRERQSRGERDDGDKDLWKELRIRKNERGEYVLLT